MDRFWKMLRWMFILSSLGSVGFLFLGNPSLGGLTALMTSSPAPAPDAGNTAAPAGVQVPMGKPDPNAASKLAGLISAAAPGSAQAQMAAGALYLKKGMSAEAMATFQKAERLDPKNPDTHFRIGMILSGEGKNEEAEKQFREAMRLDPEHTDSRFGLAVLLQRQSRYDDAAALYKEINRIKPLNAEAHNNLGIIYDQQGRREEALTEFKTALDLAPADTMIRQNFLDMQSEKERDPGLWARGNAASLPPPPGGLQEAAPAPAPEPATEAAPAAPAFEGGDTLRLANGRVVHGRIAEKTADGVWLEFGNGKVFFSNSEISAVNPEEKA